MSADKPLMKQLVEILAVAEATGWPPKNEPVVVITVRPDPDSFHPHSIALKKATSPRPLRPSSAA